MACCATLPETNAAGQQIKISTTGAAEHSALMNVNGHPACNRLALAEAA